jgi:hypothetical protein
LNELFGCVVPCCFAASDYIERLRREGIKGIL